MRVAIVVDPYRKCGTRRGTVFCKVHCIQRMRADPKLTAAMRPAPIDAAACYAELLGNRGGTQLSAQLPDLRRII